MSFYFSRLVQACTSLYNSKKFEKWKVENLCPDFWKVNTKWQAECIDPNSKFCLKTQKVVKSWKVKWQLADDVRAQSGWDGLSTSLMYKLILIQELRLKCSSKGGGDGDGMEMFQKSVIAMESIANPTAARDRWLQYAPGDSESLWCLRLAGQLYPSDSNMNSFYSLLAR